MNRANAPVRAILSLAVALALGAHAASANAQQGCSVVAKINPTDAISTDDLKMVGGVLTPATVTLDGSGSHGSTFSWTQTDTSGFRVKLSNPGSATATFQAPDVPASGAVLTFRLTVNGCNDKVRTADVVVNIADRPAANTTPVVSASFQTADGGDVISGSTVTLTGSAVDDGPADKLRYLWAQTAGRPVTWLTPLDVASPRFTAPAIGSEDLAYEFVLRVSDGMAEGVAKVVIGVNRPPKAVALCPLRANEGADIVLDGSTSKDLDGPIASYRWDQTSIEPKVEVGDATAWSRPTLTVKAPKLGENQIGHVPFRLTVIDGNNVPDSADCQVMIDDVTPPTITAPADMDADATSASGAERLMYAASAYDAFDGVISEGERFSCRPASGSDFPFGTTTVACDARDWSGNTATARFNVTVSDKSAPALTVPASIAVEAKAALTEVEFDVQARDIVDGVVAASCDAASGSPFPLGSTRVTCGATDKAGNEAEKKSFDVVVHDTTPPAFSTVGDLAFEATSPSGANATYTLPIATDLVDGQVDVTCSPASGTTLGLGTHAVTCTASDKRAEPNTATTGFTIEVADTIAPEIGTHGDEVIEATGPNGAMAFYSLPAVTDAVSPDLKASCSPASATVFRLGTTTVTCTAVDGAGNAATPTTFKVDVRDTTAPVLSIPATGVVAEATSSAGAAVSFALPTASDLVDGAVDVTCDAASGSTFALGTTAVTCSATDRAGNTAARSFDVLVRDTTAPSLTGLVNVSAFATAASQAVVNYTQPRAVDLVDGSVPVTCSPAPGSTFNVGTTTVTCSVSDIRGNTATGSFTVSVGYNFTGFLQPVDNLPTINVAKAGSAVPVKFSLGGNQGLAIMEAGFPKSGPTACLANGESAVEQTVTAGGSSLQYDALTAQYTYVWKTEKSWTGCRTLSIKLKDGSVKSAAFTFR